MNPSDSTGSHAGRILMVDDTPSNLRLLVTILQQHAYMVHPATSGPAALRFLETTLPDLILLDVMMPGMDGYQVCERLKADPRTGDIPVIFISAADQPLNKIRAFGCGGVDYIVKPFETDEVLARIATHIALHRLKQDLEQRVAERTGELLQINRRLSAEIEERQRAERRIRHMAYHDPLTGLPNRVLLLDRMLAAIAQAHRTEQLVAAMFIDLDYFKNINDSLGHGVGDELLKAAATRLTHCLREGDSVARLGGDEFVILLPALDHGDDAAWVAQKALDALTRPFHVDSHELRIGASIGISLCPTDGADPDALMGAADAAMYFAKERGRGNFQFFTRDLNCAAQHRLTTTNRLRRALGDNDLIVHYQPEVNLISGRIVSAEALLRWRQPGGDLISFGQFIDIAEETGLIQTIGEWTLRQACAQLKRWHDSGHRELRIAVNLSPRQLVQRHFELLVADCLRETALPANALELEITEGTLMQPSPENLFTMAALVAMGVRLAVDDFGTGYSNLAALSQLPVHALKIDRSFVTGIEDQPERAAIVTAILALAESLKLNVVAEGVENRAQVQFLKARGCQSGQGYYYGAPVAPDAFARLLT